MFSENIRARCDEFVYLPRNCHVYEDAETVSQERTNGAKSKFGSVGSGFETLSLPSLPSLRPRSFTFYVADPVRYIPRRFLWLFSGEVS